MTPTPHIQEFTATDPDAFGASATPEQGSRLVLRGRGPFFGWRRHVAPDDLRLNEGRVNIPTTFHTAVGARAIFSFGPLPGTEAILNGRAFPQGALAWWRAGAEVHTQWPADIPWWNIILSLPRFEAAVITVLGAPLLLPRDAVRFVLLAPDRHGRLAFLLSEARGAPPGTPIADALLLGLIGALAFPPEAPPPAPDPLSRGRRRMVVDGLVAIADRAEGSRSLVTVCAELGVPLRTLNGASNAVLGLSAATYLRQRRLNRVHRDLRAGAAASVTEAAMRHGFWELGRFAAGYRALFGEAPSATLRRRAA